jgi:hypothetical protein
MNDGAIKKLINALRWEKFYVHGRTRYIATGF